MYFLHDFFLSNCKYNLNATREEFMKIDFKLIMSLLILASLTSFQATAQRG